MIPVRKNSKIEVCSADYINKHYNNEEDKDSKIVQIEHGYNGDYIVELVNRKNPFSWWRPISEYNTSRRCEPMLIKIFNRNTKQYTAADRTVSVGQKYRHFKGKIVEVLAISQDAEMPGQFIVVYIDKDNYVWHRPLGMFLSEVDHEKYPLVKQKYRFELLRGC